MPDSREHEAAAQMRRRADRSRAQDRPGESRAFRSRPEARADVARVHRQRSSAVCQITFRQQGQDACVQMVRPPEPARARSAGELSIPGINWQLEVLRRMRKLAAEWSQTEKSLPKVALPSGNNHPHRVFSGGEEQRQFATVSARASCSATSRRFCSIAPYAPRNASGCAERSSRMVRCTSCTARPRTPVA
jgi:hypothetical protein